MNWQGRQAPVLVPLRTQAHRGGCRSQGQVHFATFRHGQRTGQGSSSAGPSTRLRGQRLTNQRLLEGEEEGANLPRCRTRSIAAARSPKLATVHLAAPYSAGVLSEGDGRKSRSR